ncbi:sialin-like [Onthophagus taurus]|uniref:sialin-like n=1 Tax=Onthophagus taurus TaxID=166361 RepID=UPI0039BE5FB6
MEEEKKGFFGVINCRIILAFLGAVGMAIVYGLKVNLSIAIVAMINHTALVNTSGDEHVTADACHFDDSNNEKSVLADGPFPWSASLQGIILSSYFWGYLIALLPAGVIAENSSAKWTMFFAVVINVVCTALTPICSHLHYSLLVLMRVAEGIGGGVTFPAMHVLLAKWSLPTQRTMMSSVVYSGTSLGTVLSTLLAGVIELHMDWEWIFYLMAIGSAIWIPLWVVLVHDNPNKSPIVTEKEKKMINDALGDTEHTGKKFPIKAVFSSLPFWAILIAHTCSNWGWYMILIILPLYLRDIVRLNVMVTAKWIAIAFFGMWLFSLGFGTLMDTLRKKEKISTTVARKIATIISCAIPGGCFVALCFIGCNRWLAIVLTCTAIITIAGMFSGFLSNHIDIAPNHAGTLVAITNFVATFPGIIVPVFAGALREIDPGMFSWRIIFLSTSTLSAVAVCVYTIFASGNEQPWNND